LPSKANAADNRTNTVEVDERNPLPQALYDQDGVSVIATETQNTLELEVSEPDPVFFSVEVDRNQNGQYDRLVDVAYRARADGSLCVEYLIDEHHNTACGGYLSSAYSKNFKVDQGRKQFTVVLPKKELSLDQPSARLAFVLRNSAQRQTAFYPPERFQKAINIPYLTDVSTRSAAFQVEVSTGGWKPLLV
jgi:hypothetical protein